ncbi:hypothetical protein F7U66_01545 [Vibrio parahaemolyticus]|nr:hypothetical protein [Vibrio parahaemolyticus]
MIMERENSEIAFGFFKPFDLESVHKRNDGHMYARNYLVVTLHKAYFSKQKAERIADAHNARLTGAYPKFDWVQLWYPTNSFEELETAAITLSKDERVKEVSYDRVRIRTPNPTNK